jgi:hypothetical protein
VRDSHSFLTRSELTKLKQDFNERQTGGRNNAVGPLVCFLKANPREIFSIKFVKPAPSGNHGCTRTNPLKNMQVGLFLKSCFC